MCTWHQSIAFKYDISLYFRKKFCIPFIVISKYILINFQTNPMICIYLLTFIHALLDSLSVGSVSGSVSITSVGGEGANLSVIVYLYL